MAKAKKKGRAISKVDALLINTQGDLQMAHERLSSIKEIIDGVESRFMAADGPVTNTRHEMSDSELRNIYCLAGGKVAA